MDKVESTRKSSKSSKRRSTAIVNKYRKTSKRLRLSSEAENTISTPSVDDQNKKQIIANAPKKKRGPTQVKMIDENNRQKMDLEFNKFGQVVGTNSEKFSSIVGAMVREHVPIVIKSWHSVDEEKRKELWNFVQQRFNVSDFNQKMTLQYMGKYWRTYKSRLRKQIKAQVTTSTNRTRTIGLLRPRNVDSEEVWKKFVEDTLSSGFQEQNSKFSVMRSNQKLLHTMGRKGYPRMAHELKKKNPDIKGLRATLWTHGHLRKDGKPINEAVAETLERIEECAQSISNTPAEDSIRDDAIARVLGSERHGRVRGLGFGVTPSRVDGQIQSTERVKELESQVQSQNERVRALEEKFEAFVKSTQQSSSKNVEDRSSRASQSQQGNGIHRDIANKENARCQLVHWYIDDEDVVAEGRIATMDPGAKVHHMPLGRDCWKVWVDEVYMDHLTLFRPTDEFRVLKEALGSTVA